MSFQATSWAVRQSTGHAGRKCVLLVVANHAMPDGVCFPGRNTLAAECECRPETVTAHLAALEEQGLIARHQRRRVNGSRTTDWIVLAPGAKDRGEMHDPNPEEYPDYICELATKGSGAISSPELHGGLQVGISGGPGQSEEQTTSLSMTTSGVQQTITENGKKEDARARAQARAMVTYQGKTVPKPVLADAECVLRTFNEVTGRKLGMRTARGSASPALTQVIGAMLARPEVSAEEWKTAIRHTADNPPSWVEGQLQIGHVFGPRAADCALANDGRVRQPRGRDGRTPEEVAASAARLERMRLAMEGAA